MRGSVVFLAVFAVTSCSVGVIGAHFVKSGITGYGTGRGNEDSPGVEESAFGNGENDGHHIGKRSSLGHDIAEQAAFGSAAARRQQMIDPNAPFLKPILPPQFPPYHPIVEVLPLGPTGPILTPPLSTKPWNSQPVVKSHDLPSRRAMPSALEREVRPLPTLKYIPLSEVTDEAMKIISNALPDASILPGILAKLSAWRSFARSQDFYRSDLINRRSRYSGLRSYSPLRSYLTLPGPLTEDVIAMPLYKHVRNTAPVQLRTEENFRRELRSAVIKYLFHLWNKLSKWFEPSSNPGGGMGGLPPTGEIPVVGGKELGPSLPPEHEVHTERPPEEYNDVIIEPVTPPVDDGVEIIHLSSGDDASETAEDSTGDGGSEFDEDYYEPIYPIPQSQSNWEARHSTRMGDGSAHVRDGTYTPAFYVPMNSAKSRFYSNREARSAMGKEDGSEDVASKIKDISSRTRRKNMPDDLDTLTDIFGRLADD